VPITSQLQALGYLISLTIWAVSLPSPRVANASTVSGGGRLAVIPVGMTPPGPTRKASPVPLPVAPEPASGPRALAPDEQESEADERLCVPRDCVLPDGERARVRVPGGGGGPARGSRRGGGGTNAREVAVAAVAETEAPAASLFGDTGEEPTRRKGILPGMSGRW